MPKSIQQVRKQLANGEFDFSRHGFQRALQHNISELEINEAGELAIVIEDYPDDKYSPSCLLLEFTGLGRPLHIQVSLAETALIRIITLYEPNVHEWTNHSTRR